MIYKRKTNPDKSRKHIHVCPIRIEFQIIPLKDPNRENTETIFDNKKKTLKKQKYVRSGVL